MTSSKNWSSPYLLKLHVNGKRFFLQIHAILRQTANLPFPHPGKQGDNKRIHKPVPFHGSRKNRLSCIRGLCIFASLVRNPEGALL